MVQRPSGGHGHPVRRLSRGASPSRSSQPLPLHAHNPAVHAKAQGGELAGLRAVRGDEDRPSRQGGYVGQDVGLGLSVECARDLVEHHNGRAGAHGARDGQALELSLGEPCPCSPIAVSSPSGSSSTKSHAHAASHARLTWPSFASGAAKATFSRPVPANRKLSCGTYANTPASTWDAAHDAPSSSSHAKPSAL